uniref:Helix-turn-helix domain-containing protein n=1 Tax=Dulem virus 33 TaxID=3145751 RepID=A0AAU8B7Y0_9CAUD
MFHKVKSVAVINNLTLLVHFVEGQTKTYDVSPLFLTIPAFQAFSNTPGLFEQVKVDAGGYGISWNDDLDLSCDELWENGSAISTPFDNLIAFSDATAMWGLNESTLRKAVSYHKLIDGVDVKKFGKQWIVTLDAMKREYGEPTT